jgi:tetratricopeptide (TPR) repeat protein
VTEAERLRLAGRWDDALETLAGRDDVEAAMERVRILADVNMLVRDVDGELERAIDAVETLGVGDRRAEAFVLERRGLRLHTAFLHDRSAGEPPDELPLFEQALGLRREIGDERGIAESLFHIGLVHQVVRDDSPASLPWFQESYERAREAGDDLLRSYTVRHLGFAYQEAGDTAGAEQALRESLELRREAGWTAGVAAAELGLAGLLAERDRSDEARALAESARATLETLGATRFLAFAQAQLDELRP